MAITKEYLNQAIDMLSGNKTNEITQNQTAYKTNLQSLEGQKAGTNQNFDKQLEQNTINTTKSKNNYLNNSLSRGLGRSTIATSGAAGIQDSGNKIANVVEQDRAIAVNNIEAQKTILQQNLQATLLGLESSFTSQAQTLGQQLEAQAYARQMERESFDYKKQQDALDESFRQNQFAYQKQQDALAMQSRGSSSGSRSGSSSKSSSVNNESAWSEFDKVTDGFINKGGFNPLTWANNQLKSGAINQATYQEMYNAALPITKAKTAKEIVAQKQRTASQQVSGTRLSGAKKSVKQSIR